MRLIAIIFASAIVLAGTAACDPESPVGTAATGPVRCMPRDAGAQGLHAEWAPFAPFIDVCTLTSSGGSPVFTLISVSAQRYYSDQPNGAETTSLPKPLILAPDGREIGRLPYSYPDDPPLAIELTFSDWRGERPQRIDVLVRDPTVTGDHLLTPMRWDESTGRYTGGLEQ